MTFGHFFMFHDFPMTTSFSRFSSLCGNPAYIREMMHSACDAYLGTPYPSYYRWSCSQQSLLGVDCSST